MIVFRCQNGIVLFRMVPLKSINGLEWVCINDNSIGQQPRTAGGLEQLLRDMANKANSLRGSVLQVIDLPEIN